MTARWWSVGALALTVAASSLLVPPLVSSGKAEGRPVASAAPQPSPTSASPTPSADERFGQSPPPPPFTPIRIAATDPRNEFHDVAKIDCPTCASGSRIQYLGQGHALVVHVRDVRVGGRRKLTIVYTTAEKRPLDIIINGGSVISLTLAGRGSWTTPAEVTIPIDLPAGDTVIRLFHGTAPAPDIDQLVIR